MAKLPKSAVGKRAQVRRMKIGMSELTPKERSNLPQAQSQIAYDDIVHGKGTLTPKTPIAQRKKPQKITSRETVIDRLDQERRLTEVKKPRRRY